MKRLSTSTYSRETKGRILCLPGCLLASGSQSESPLIMNLMDSLGLLHPIIHLGFGIEFKQPAIVAEALAQAAIHPKWLDQYFIAVEEKVQQNQHSSDSLVNILDKIRADKKLSCAARLDDDNLIREGILVRAKDEMVKYASQWRVKPDQLEEATAEMTNAVGEYHDLF